MLHTNRLKRQNAVMTEPNSAHNSFERESFVAPICRFCLQELIKPSITDYKKLMICSCPSQYSYTHDICFKNWMSSVDNKPVSCNLCKVEYSKYDDDRNENNTSRIKRLVLSAVISILVHATLEIMMCAESRRLNKDELLELNYGFTSVPPSVDVPKLNIKCVYEKCYSVTHIMIFLTILFCVISLSSLIGPIYRRIYSLIRRSVSLAVLNSRPSLFT